MPYVEMRDAFGMCYRITTIGEHLLQEWFDFWLPRLYPADAPADLGNPALWVSPADDRGTPDWCVYGPAINRLFTIPRDPALALEAMRAERAKGDLEYANYRKERSDAGDAAAGPL